MLYTIENDKLSVTINSFGGSMTSVVYKPENEERLWQGGEWWNGRDVVIFPVVGHAGEFTAKGKNCLLKSHGLIRYTELELKDKAADRITLSVKSSAETEELFPYEWEFEITYTLYDNALSVGYFIRSLNGVMPFYVGGHPGLKAPGGKVKISFAGKEKPVVYPVDGSPCRIADETEFFVADKSLFKKHKTLQLGLLTGGAIYADCTDGYRYTYKSDCPVWAFWSNENGGDYVCVEPWWGINDMPDLPKEITLKPFINYEYGSGSNFGYSLTIEK